MGHHMGGIWAVDPKDVAKTAWAFATAGRKDSSLFAALATAVEHHMGGIWALDPLEVAKTAWAFATAGRKASSLFAALAVAQLRMANASSFAELATAAWGAAN